MEGLEENRKEIGRDGAPPPTARHRRFWRGLGTFAIVLACVTVPSFGAHRMPLGAGRRNSSWHISCGSCRCCGCSCI